MKTTSLVLMALFAASAAQASTIDFDSFNDGDLVTSVGTTDGAISASISAIGGANEARAFDTTVATFDDDLESPFVNDLDESIVANPGNVLIVQESIGQASGTPDDNRSGGVITFIFDQVVNFTGFSIFDDATVTITGSNGAIATSSVSVDGAFNDFTFAPSLFAGVSSLTFDFNGASGAIDNISVTAVPVPATLPLLLAGLGGFAALRRRKG